jgi:hypothetical protein
MTDVVSASQDGAGPPSEQWRAAVALPEISEAEQVAERLVLLAHYGADFDVWGGARRVRYWDAFAERVKAATYAGPGLTDWWSAISRSLPTSPRDAREREDVARLLAYSEARAVLKVLRARTDVTVLRVRVIAEHRRAAWKERNEDI